MSASCWAEAFGPDTAGLVPECEQQVGGRLDEAGGAADVTVGLQLRRPAPGRQVVQRDPAGRARPAVRRRTGVEVGDVEARIGAPQLRLVVTPVGVPYGVEQAEWHRAPLAPAGT